MAGLVGLIVKQNEVNYDHIKDIFSNMLKSLDHRGKYYYIYNGETFDVYNSYNKFEIDYCKQGFLIGFIVDERCKFLEINTKLPAVISDGIYYDDENFMSFLNGRKTRHSKFRNNSNCKLCKQLHLLLKSKSGTDLVDELKKLIVSIDPRFQEQTSVIILQNGIYLVKDLLGIHPLFILNTRDFTSFSSERKAFWKNKLNGEIFHLKPGSIIKITNKFVKELYHRPVSSVIKFGTMLSDTMINEIKKNLLDSIYRRLSVSDNNIGLFYSGGLDSSLLKFYLEKYGPKIFPFIVGIPGSKDLITSSISDDVVILVEIDKNNLLERMIKILEIIEQPDFLALEIAFLFYYGILEAKKFGLKNIMVGQGADELFCGYKKYQRFLKADYQLYINNINRDLDSLAFQNLEASELVASYFGTRLYFPYLDISLIQTVRAVEPKHHIDLKKGINKLILRKIASQEKIDQEITNKKKYALQYSSGIHHTFDKFIRNLGFNKFLSKELGYENRYRELFMDYSFFILKYPTKLTTNQFEKINKKIKVKY